MPLSIVIFPPVSPPPEIEPTVFDAWILSVAPDVFAIDISALLLVAPALFSDSVPELMVTFASVLVPFRVSVFDPILTNDPAPEMDPEYVESAV